MSGTMKAYVTGTQGASLAEAPIPSPSGVQVLVRVHACGLNRADLLMRGGSGHGFSLPPGVALGTEWSGEVVALGPEAQGLPIGARVMGTGRGAFAQFKLADHGQLFPVPDSMSFEEAATLPTALTTMHNALVTVGRLAPGQAVLVQGASSGVGLMGMQIARLKGAGIVIGSSTDERRRKCLHEFGADLAIDSSDPRWVEEVLEATGGRGVDLVIDQVSGALANLNLAATRVGGRIVNVGRLGGSRAEFDFDLHAARRIDYVGVTFRTRTIEEIRDIFRDVRKDIWSAVEARQLLLPIDRVFPFEAIETAFEHMAANRHLGKIVVSI